MYSPVMRPLLKMHVFRQEIIVDDDIIIKSQNMLHLQNISIETCFSLSSKALKAGKLMQALFILYCELLCHRLHRLRVSQQFG